MIGLLIYTNLDLLYLPTISTLGDVTPILMRENFDEFENTIIKHYFKKGKITELFRVKDSQILGNSIRSLHPLGVNSISKVRFIINQNLNPVIFGIKQDYDVLKGIFLKEGTLNFSRYLKDNEVMYYLINPSKYPNDLSIDCDPFEFLLIQNGLSRIDRYEFEDDSFNTESNEECWERYINYRIELYEIDSLPR